MQIFNSLFGIQAAAQATQLTQAGLSRRGFLAGLGGLTALTVFGCGTSDTGPDGSHLGDGGSGGTDAGTDGAIPTRFTLQDHYAQLPCHYPSDLEFVTDRMIGVATPGGSQVGDRNHLFRFNPDAAMPIMTGTELDLTPVSGRTLAHFARKTGNRAVITTNDGFYEVTLGVPSATRFIAFPSGVTYGGGALYVGAKLFVAAANLNASFVYDLGQVLVYDLDGTSSVQTSSDLRRVTTSRLNPTGMAFRASDNRLVVLNSGDFTSGARASIDLININASPEVVAGSIQLGALTTQVGAELALSADGRTAVVGTADGSGKVLFVNLETGDIAEQTVAGTQFHSSVKIDQNYGIVYVTDFNSGKVTVLNLATRAILSSIALASGAGGNVEAGPSELYDGALIQTLPYAAVRIVPE
jgi:hypothetical protein